MPPPERDRGRRRGLDTFLVFIALAALSAAAVAFVASRGWTLYYGDAEAHLNIARRVVDSRTPGYGQIGGVWLPIPHLLMLPFVGNDRLWQTGLAGAIPSAACFVMAGMFMFAAMRRLFDSTAAAAATAACFALNPNLLYLQSAPMTEAVMFAGVMGLLYSTIAFEQTQSLVFIATAGLASIAASLTRYEGWFLIPFATLFFYLASRRHRFAAALAFGALASLGPLYWFAHNWWYSGDFLDFYRGPYSPRAIQAGADYPGLHDWAKSWLYLRTAIRLVSGYGALWAAAIGLLAVLLKRAWWPLLFLALAPAFYLWSMHSSGGTPIFVPELWTRSYYNTRYGLTAWPLLAWCAGAAVLWLADRWRRWGALSIAGLCICPWLIHPSQEAWICWKESEVNSVARRAWTHLTANYLREHYRTGTGIFSTAGDVAGVFREAGIPLREVLHEGNGPAWLAAVTSPELFLTEEWAVAIHGDRIANAAGRAHYRMVQVISVPGAPSVEIYQRQ